MPRWLRLVRGMVGTGLTFAAGVGGVVSIFGAVAWLRGRATVIEVLETVGRFSVAGFVLGVGFAGVLVVAARTGLFKKLSLRVGTSLGVGAGLLYWLVLASTGGRAWSPRLAVLNLVLLVVMGGGLAAATVLIARRAGSVLGRGDELPSVGAGDEEVVHDRRNSKVEVPRR
jgi:hypothetical protein